MRFSTKIPDLPKTIPLFVRSLARVNQAFIYIFMFSVPLSGYAMSNMFGRGVDFFGLTELPKIFPENAQMGRLVHDSHGFLAYSLLVFVVLHILGVLKHKFFDRNPNNDVLKTMV